ncbi:MAG: alpha/beta hydrolase family protein [Actinomycetota bacterium]
MKRPGKKALATSAVVVMAAGAWAVPFTRARLKAVAVLADAAGVPFPRPFAPDVEITEEELAQDVTGDLYAPSDDAPVILFVPGAAEEGRDDPRVIRAATALAKAGRRVFVPELNLYKRTLDRDDIERIATAIELLARDDPIGILGFSYGGSLALIAASDPRVSDGVSFVATFGAYFDLHNVIQGITTGVTILDGSEVAFDRVPMARSILTSAAIDLASEAYAGALRAAIEAEDPRRLTPPAAAIYRLLMNRDPERAAGLVAATPARFRRALEDFSPAGVLHRLGSPLYILQSKRDAATPWTEAVLLDRAVGRSRLVMLNHFLHVDPPGVVGWLTDGPKAWWFLSWVLEEQE